MIRNISLHDPYMYYRLDPGEVGPVLPVKARESVMHVASHEAANLARMKYDAWSKGGIIVYEHLHINYTKRGNYIAASSGYSEVRVIYPSRKGEAPSIYPDHFNPKVNSDYKINKDSENLDIEGLKIEKEVVQVEQEIDKALKDAEKGIDPQRAKEAIKAYKTILSIVKGLKNSTQGKKIAESIIASIKNKVRNEINLFI